MTLTQLHYIIAIDTHRHFATAAEHCFVTQPTLSMQIQKLEEELDILIFDRTKQPVIPTEVGEKIIRQARIILDETKRIQDIIDESKGVIEGDFRLGIIPTVASTLLPRFLKKFHKKHPKVELHIEELQTEHLIEKLKTDQLDAGIVATPLTETGIIEAPLYYEPFMGFIPKNHRLAEEEFILGSELDPKDLLLLNEGHCFRNSVLSICSQSKKDLTQNFTLQSGSFETLIKLSRQGMGMTLIPYLFALELKRDQTLIKPFDHPKPQREISLIYTRSQLKMQVIKALEKVIQRNVPENLLEGNSGRTIHPFEL